MIWAAIEKWQDKEFQKHAGGKAREDLDKILLNNGIKELPIIAPQNERRNVGVIKKLLYHFEIERIWIKEVNSLQRNDSLILQFPVVNHTLFLNRVVKHAKKMGVKVYAFIHDLEIIRMSNTTEISTLEKWRIKREELDELKLFDGIVVHNNKMKEYLHQVLRIENEKMIELGIFDYLIDESFIPNEGIDNYTSCIIAGNLNRNKSSYVYKLPVAPDFELYGINFEGVYAPNIHYHGSFLANELPYHLEGGFGLVWDGDSSESCSGVWGEYLRYNNPHKTSLYLACGIPVIIWKEAALAGLIEDKCVGITIDSLEEIHIKLAKMTRDEYRKYKDNAIRLSTDIRNGIHTLKVIERLENFSLINDL